MIIYMGIGCRPTRASRSLYQFQMLFIVITSKNKGFTLDIMSQPHRTPIIKLVSWKFGRVIHIAGFNKLSVNHFAPKFWVYMKTYNQMYEITWIKICVHMQDIVM